MAAIAATLSILATGLTSPASAQWVRTRGPYGGSVSALVSDGITAYAGTWAGVFKSTDSGMSWSATGWLGMGFGNIRSLAMNGSSVYAGNSDTGIYRSTDAGSTWSDVSKGLPRGVVHCLAVSGSMITAGTGSGAYRTTNGGGQWLPCNHGLPRYRVPFALALHDTTIVAGTDSGFYRMSLNDTSWTWTGCGFNQLRITGIAWDSTGFWAATSGGVYYSSDDGATWINRLPAAQDAPFVSIFANRGVVYAGTYLHLFRSEDTGASWSISDSGLNQAAESFAACGSVLIAGGYTMGTYRSTDNGLSWREGNEGLSTQYIVALGAEGNMVLANAEYAGFCLSSDAGVNWSKPNIPIGTPKVSSFATIGTTLLAGSGSGMLRSTDDGLTWIKSIVGLTDTAVSVLQSSGSIVFAACDTALFRSTDSGMTWIHTASLLGPFPIAAVTSIGRYILVSCESRMSVLRSSDYGQSWPDTVGIQYSSQINRLISVDGRLFAATANGVFISIDSGSTWTRTDWGKGDGGIASWEVYDIVSSGTNLFAAAIFRVPDDVDDSAGIFFSSDFGSSWRRIDEGLPKFLGAQLLAVGKSDLFAGVGSSGVWRRPLAEMISVSSVEEPTAVPMTFSMRVSPNPFVDRVSIEYDASVREGVDVKVFNSLGVETARLFSGTLEAGTHSFTWDASGVAPGLYECIVRTRDGVRSLPIVLMR